MDATWLTDLALFGLEEAQGGFPGWLVALMPWLGIGLLFYLLLIRPQQRERAKRQTMLAAVKKNDRVLTAGGVYGVVTNIRPEADEVTVKVDEATNTKLRMTLGSISQVLGGEPSDEGAK